MVIEELFPAATGEVRASIDTLAGTLGPGFRGLGSARFGAGAIGRDVELFLF